GSSPADTDWILDAFVTSLFVDARDAVKMVADVDITYYVFRSDGGGMPVWTQTYRQRAPLSAPRAPADGAALNVPLGPGFAGLSRHLAAATLTPGKRCPPARKPACLDRRPRRADRLGQGW